MMPEAFSLGYFGDEEKVEYNEKHFSYI